LEGGLVVGHGGRNGRQCLCESSPVVDEVGSDQLGEQLALSPKSTTRIIAATSELLQYHMNKLSASVDHMPFMRISLKSRMLY